MTFDATKIDGYDSVSDGASTPIAPGRYHVRIIDVDDSRMTPSGKLVNRTAVNFAILAGTVPTEVGKVLNQSFWYDNDTGAPSQALIRLVMAGGLLQPGQQREIALETELVNLEFVIGTDQWQKDGKTRWGIANRGCDIWSLDHPEVASVPRHQSGAAPAPTAQVVPVIPPPQVSQQPAPQQPAPQQPAPQQSAPQQQPPQQQPQSNPHQSDYQNIL